MKFLIHALLDELKRISNDHKINIQLDGGTLAMLQNIKFDGLNIDDVVALFRPADRVCQVEVLVDKPVYLPVTHTLGVPLRQEKAVIIADKDHFAVNLEQGVPYRKEIPYVYSETKVLEVPTTV